jgi:hypothetical protein
MSISNPISLSNKSSWFILICRRKLEKEWLLEVLSVVLKKLTLEIWKKLHDEQKLFGAK